MRYLYQRNSGKRGRVVHLTGFDFYTGEPTMRPLCRRVNLPFDTTCNLPLGRRTCRHCLKAAAR